MAGVAWSGRLGGRDGNGTTFLSTCEDGRLQEKGLSGVLVTLRE